TPDVEAGWAALAARLDVPLAPVVPMRKPSRARTVALAVAAAMLLAGAAFAAVAHFENGRAGHPAPGSKLIHVPVTGPHAHMPFAGPPAHPQPANHHHGGGTGTGAGDGSGSGSGDGGSGNGSGGGTSKPGDDPNDRDQGTGNDGHHNDHGGGNNGAEGTPPHTSHGEGH
ncbi:MAG: hypothetical protein ABJB55_03930, partial [Actinomycetota bacterium]